jgi:hypothetical protein
MQLELAEAWESEENWLSFLTNPPCVVGVNGSNMGL